MRFLPALALAGSALAITCGGAPAFADDAKPAAPPSGTAVAVTEDGDMMLECEGTLHRFDLHGAGQLTAGDRTTAPDGSPGVIVSTTSENLTGYDPDLGMVTVAERAPAAGELVSPVPGHAFPAAEAFAQDVTVSFEHDPCDTSGAGAPATFHSTKAFPLLNTNLKAFPPRNSVYTLLEPVELVPVDSPRPATIQLLQFPVTVSQSS